MTTKVLTVEGIVDQSHLELIVDLINTEAYVSHISEPADNGEVTA